MNTQQFNTPLRCVFFGSDAFAVTVLEHLLARPDIVTIVGVVCRPGRLPAVTATPTTAQLLQPTKLDAPFFESYKELHPDIAVVASYGAIIPQRVLDVATAGTWNVHPSLLPLFRGPTPVETALREGARQTGVSIMLLDALMDHGPIFARETYTIPSGIYAPELRQELSTLGGSLLVKTLEKFIRQPFAPEEQDHTAATYTAKITTANTAIDLVHQSLPDIAALVHSCPGEAWFTLASGRRVAVIAATHSTGDTPAERSFVATKRAIQLVDGTDVLTFDVVQVAGGRPIDAQQFANGYRAQLPDPTRK